MTDQNIIEIIRLRWAVYHLGAEAGIWHTLNDEDVKGFMEFLFPKSHYIAQYNLMLNIVRNSDAVKNVPGGHYCLFKFPEQIEEKLLGYLKNHTDLDFSNSKSTSMDYLEELGTIVSDADLFGSSVGSLDQIGLEDMLRILAYRYSGAFANSTYNFPYFS